MTIHTLVHDVRYAARTLARNPGFTAVAVAVLALGIGATTAIFSLVSAVILRPLPFVEPDRLVVLWEDLTAMGGPAQVELTPGTYVAWKERAGSFDDMAALVGRTYNLTGEGEPERLGAVRTTTNLFLLLGVQPILGRTFTAGDEGPEAAPVAIITEDLWKRRFGSDPDLISRSILLDGQSYAVIGVVPSDFRFPNGEVAVWVPLSFAPQELTARAYYVYAVARLRAGIALSQARAELTTIATTLREEGAPVGTLGATVASLHEYFSHDARPTLRVLVAAVGAVLLITCANVANLLLARGANRRRELAVRKALGAGAGRVLRQLLTESTVLASLGVIVGIALSMLSFEYLARLMPGNYPQGVGPGLDWRVLSFTVAISLLTVLLFGAGPALAASRLDVNEALKKNVGALRSGRMRNALVVTEMTLTVVLLIAAGLLLRSYSQVLSVDPGFRADGLLIAQTALSPSQYAEPAARSAFYERLLERVQALPGVSSAGYVSYPPLVFDGGRSLVVIDGQPLPPPEELARNITSDRVVSNGYLSTLGVPLIRGRFFDDRDTQEAAPSVLINEAMARLHWPNADPIGARVKIGGPQSDAPWYTVVGVVGDMRQMGLEAPGEPEMYYAYAQRPRDGQFAWPSHLVVRTVGDPMALASAVRNAVWEVDANQPVSNIRTMSDVVDVELTYRNTQLTLVGSFAVLALLLASVGLYGVLSYTIAQRTSEIGLRIALGAERRIVVRSVLRSALLLAGLGIALGMPAALGLTRLLASFLFGVGPADPATLAGVCVLLLLVTAFASYLPARRAASVDPMAALRVD